ncbi:hypothetical protein [Enterococcus mundtii]|uniref:hypothetical protein n=1 Tax=Enterococcus mundtii TaxID=53346 RepID=UPI002DB5F3FD|nr:hypothetical protein [Enterococcus mundtii]MEC3942434.1 hypothetical protein [Enterococcus mundtii]
MNIERTNLSSQIAVATKATAVTMKNLIATIDTGVVAEQGGQLIDALYCTYLNSNDDFTIFDIELGIPINTAISASDEVYMSQTYSGKAVIAPHQGAYVTLETPEDELLTQVIFPIN